MFEHLADNVFFSKSSDRRWAVLLLLRTIRVAPSDAEALPLRRRAGQRHALVFAVFVIVLTLRLTPDFLICLALYELGFLTTTFYLEQRTREWDPAPAGWLFGDCPC